MYNRLFKKVLYPFYESSIKKRNTLKYLDALNTNQWKSLDELQDIQWAELKNLITHSYQQSPYYRKLFDKANLHPDKINSYEDFQGLPLCTRNDVVEHKNEMIAESYASSISSKSTGGSTGVPVQFALDNNSYEWRTAAAQRGYQWAGCEAGQPTVYIWGVDVGEPTYLKTLKGNLYHRAFNRKMFNCFDFDDDRMAGCISYLNRKRPNGIVAFTSAIYNLARFAEERNLRIEPVPAVITGAEKLLDYQRELIEKIFHTKVFNTYGCREFMLIAAECEKHEGLHVTMDNLFVEILKDGQPAKPGESGDVVITDLHNYGMPFIRYKNGDIAVQGEKPCSCGRGLPLIQGVDGRKLDEIIATNGKVVSGAFFPHLMKEFDEIGKFQVIQTSKDNLTIKLKLKQPLIDERKQFCINEMKKVLGQDMNFEFDFVEDIPLTLTGKYRVTISQLAH